MIFKTTVLEIDGSCVYKTNKFDVDTGIAVYDNMGHRLNKISLICYHIHLIFPSLSDFYFSPLSAIERWSCTFWLTW